MRSTLETSAAIALAIGGAFGLPVPSLLVLCSATFWTIDGTALAMATAG
ncbi:MULTISPECIES: hypothetical protein [unclassified Mesorhizobium]|nr:MULTISPECIES: hypothetical protein [unclassified Mesorhizobium]MCA0028278.1 hypothetical protein [Mesorhizobium sp. B263B1A]